MGWPASSSIVAGGLRRIEHDGLHCHRRHPLRVDAGTQLAGGRGILHQLREQGEQRRVSDLHLGRMRYQQPRREVGEQRALRRRIRPRCLEQQLDRDLQPLHRVVVARGGGADLVGGAAQRVLEKCEQKLVFTIELQVEAPQRLTRAVDDLLDGEVGAALLDDDRLGGVEESLDPLGGPELRCLDRPFDRALLPGGFFAGARHRRLGCLPIGENMNRLYRRTPCHCGPRPPRGQRVGDCNFLTMRILFSSC